MKRRNFLKAMGATAAGVGAAGRPQTERGRTGRRQQRAGGVGAGRRAAAAGGALPPGAR